MPQPKPGRVRLRRTLISPWSARWPGAAWELRGSQIEGSPESRAWVLGSPRLIRVRRSLTLPRKATTRPDWLVCVFTKFPRTICFFCCFCEAVRYGRKSTKQGSLTWAATLVNAEQLFFVSKADDNGARSYYQSMGECFSLSSGGGLG